ncbi:PACE efflux transporter [Vibrio aestuarianus]|uniref:Membrane protein n=1 Tax=Vibrio aestuarianus TaxID=28171 RepID=A0ABM9FQS5_9VIBR|nr:PACE efflux transporter [Vibrio aestuarianus]MDE1215104.1 PACE efflux transporter [Vibrio aestuarianus]MDE1217092.1 PACE efflux transporter [Vibrio aestuarianus]MDE1228192.1 PACE efflux transporter [Vibrio aestuarianus]MDE1256833.1 PACE efflux transporter [Vibrio aestuarianus]MDE1262230.1 PACE efflux transporter [Vibrio aestuarianus]
MSVKERIFHAVVFELTALAILIPLSALITGQGSGDLAMVGAGLSLLAVVWNYQYNILFDRLFGSDRSGRSAKIRLLHTTGFEGGLVCVSIPAIAWILEITLWQALILDIGFLVFFFIYTMVFNWCYDKWQPYKLLSLRSEAQKSDELK